MFAVRRVPYHYLVADGVGVVDTRSVFSLVVLDNQLLLPIFNVFPVSLERYVEESVPAER